MAIYFISGKPGGGKTYFALRKIVDELVLTDRYIVTNVELVLGELNAYLQDEYPKACVDLLHRVRILDRDECGKFWLYRPHGHVVSEYRDPAGVDRLDFADCGLGTEGVKRSAFELPSVVYVIDEIHHYFNARKWMKTGEHALFYLSQHRKLGDDVLCLTQSVGNVDRQFRSVAQEFIYIRNHGKERLGMFKGMKGFSRKHFLSPVEPGATIQRPMETAYFRLDATRLAKCYKTAAGVGIMGTAADVGERRRGVPIWILGFGIVAVLVGIWFVPAMVRGAIGKLGTKARVLPATVVVQATNDPSREPLVVRQPSTAVKPLAAVGSRSNLFLVGIVVVGKHCRLYFSDGSSVDDTSPRVRLVGLDYAIVDDVRYQLRSRVDKGR